MGRLLNPGLGDILDRISILHLKVVRKPYDGKSIDHYEEELRELHRHADGVEGVVFYQYSALAAVNSTLWDCEDELRSLRTAGGSAPIAPDRVRTIGMIAVQIQELNDRRAELIALINANAGVKGAEK